MELASMGERVVGHGKSRERVEGRERAYEDCGTTNREEEVISLLSTISDAREREKRRGR
jgi:hypothetical protein